jgi:phospholipid/cholesterol/gamma-HCH transport system substrate-binding protein
MKFRIKYADQVVGVFLMLSLVLVASALVFIAVNQRWFVHNASFKSVFASANSISVGTAISLRGFEIGKISKLSLTKDNQVDIEFTVYNEYIDKVTMNSVLELSTSPIGLGTSLIFHKGKSGQRLTEGELVPAIDSEKGKSMVEAGLVDIPKKDDTIARLLSSVNTVLENVNTTVLLLNATLEGKSKGPVGEVLDNVNVTLRGATKAMTDFSGTMDWVQTSFGPVAQGAGDTLTGINSQLPAVFAQVDSLLKQMNEAVANLQQMTESLKDTNGLVPRLMGDPALMTNIEQVIAGLNTAMGQVQTMLAGLNAEVPKLSSTLTEVRGAIASAQDVMEGLKNNPLLKGGITEKSQQQALFQSLRKEEF